MQTLATNRASASTNEISVVERRNNLWSAYERYMQGHITAEELEQIVSQNTPRLFKGPQRPTLSSLIGTIAHFITSSDRRD